MKARALLVAFCLAASAAEAVPVTITLSNWSTDPRYGWSQGLITLQPLIAVGRTPQPGTPQYFTYAYLTARCNLADQYCNGNCVDDGNAQILAQRWGLTLGVNAWLVPPVPYNGGTVSVTIDAPVGSRVSYVARGGDTISVMDDFIALHQQGSPTVLSAPLFDGAGQVLNPVVFGLSGYDANSTNPNNGAGTGQSGSCTPACPTKANGCYVAVGSASSSSSGTLPGPPPSPIARLVALSGNARNTLTWTNVAPNAGVVVVRSTGTPVTKAPTNGNTYAVGASLGSGNVVVFTSSGENGPNSFVDTYGPPVNGTRYYYKVFARDSANRYASGDVPSTSGIFSIPTPGALPNPRWCYSFGFASTMQPVMALGSGVFLASNSGGITANNPDGSERFRPVQLSAPIQGRFLALPLAGRSGTYLIAGDQAGNVTVVNAQSGAVVWARNVASRIQAQPSTQLYAASNAAWQAAHPGRDLIYIASRNSSTTNNTVTALSSVDGSTVWQYAPGNLDIVSGGMLLDRTNNRLWVASRGNPSLRVLSTIDGALVASFSVGDVDLPVAWGYTYGEAIVTNTSGGVSAYNLGTFALSWTHAPGALTSYAFPTGNGYIASLASGSVQRFTVDQTTKAVSPMWSPAAAIASPTGVRVDYANQKVVLGNSAGNLSQLNAATGVIERTVTVASGIALGTPNVDPNLSRLYVTGVDGRLCSYDVPF